MKLVAMSTKGKPTRKENEIIVFKDPDSMTRFSPKHGYLYHKFGRYTLEFNEESGMWVGEVFSKVAQISIKKFVAELKFN